MQTIDVKQFQDTVNAAQSVLVLLPLNPDFDAVAAALSLSLSLKNSGKDVTVASPSQMTVEFNRLVGVNRISDRLGDKNLAITFPGYQADGIEKVSYDVNDGKFTLLVVPKPGMSAPKRDQVNINHSGVSADLIVVVKAENKNSLGKFANDSELFTQDRKVALVGSTPAQGFSAALEVIDPQASTASEVVAQILEQMGLALDKDVATNLLMGIRAGTNNFQSRNVSARTFATASQLMNAGAAVEGPSRPPQQPRPRSQREDRGQQRQGNPPQDWVGPKVYKGSTLP